MHLVSDRGRRVLTAGSCLPHTKPMALEARLCGRGAAPSDIHGLALLPDQELANWGRRHQQRELRFGIVLCQVLGGLEQLFALGRLMSHEQVLGHASTRDYDAAPRMNSRDIDEPIIGARRRSSDGRAIAL